MVKKKKSFSSSKATIGDCVAGGEKGKEKRKASEIGKKQGMCPVFSPTKVFRVLKSEKKEEKKKSVEQDSKPSDP
jgi:hypothetical protein